MTIKEEQYYRKMLGIVCEDCYYCGNAEKCEVCLFNKINERAIEALKEKEQTRGE